MLLITKIELQVDIELRTVRFNGSMDIVEFIRVIKKLLGSKIDLFEISNAPVEEFSYPNLIDMSDYVCRKGAAFWEQKLLCVSSAGKDGVYNLILH